MGKTKEVFTEIREQEVQQEYHEQQRQIFEAWGEIYGVKRVTKSNQNEGEDI